MHGICYPSTVEVRNVSTLDMFDAIGLSNYFADFVVGLSKKTYAPAIISRENGNLEVLPRKHGICYPSTVEVRNVSTLDIFEAIVLSNHFTDFVVGLQLAPNSFHFTLAPL